MITKPHRSSAPADGGSRAHVWAAMSFVVDPESLRRELARRGLSASDLARLSGLSAATITAALAGRPIAAKSLQFMAKALAEAPSIAVIDVLIAQGPAFGSLA